MKNIKKLTALVSAIVLSTTVCAFTANAEEIPNFRQYSYFIDEYIDTDAYNDFINADLTQSAEIGDVNHNGSIDLKDAAMIKMYYMDINTSNADLYTEEQHENFRVYGDFDQNNTINILDTTHIMIKFIKENPDFTLPITLGDLNHDGFVDAEDATLVMMYYADLSTDNYDNYTEEVHKKFCLYGDMNGDGYVNSIDATLISIKYAENSTQQ